MCACFSSRTLALLLASTAFVLAAGEPLVVSARMKANEPWKEYPTTTVASLGGFRARTAPAQLSQYGGDSSHKGEAKGFFYTKRTGRRWCLVDPDGCLFIHVAACSVTPSRGSKGAEEAFDTKFGSEDKWAQATAELLRANGFNGTGAWSADGLLRKTARPLVYTPIWNFMSAYGKQRGGTFQKPGHTGYPNDAIFVFDPGFETFAMKHAEKLAATKDDPWLLGHFSDNELPFYRKTLDGFLALKPDDHGYKAARAWLDGHKGKDATAKDIGNAEREAFLGFVIDRYFAIVSKAIKTHDPNHLFLGSRFHSDEKKIEAAFQAAGKYCDVVSVNLYHAWTPDSEQLANWGRWSGKPFMITEFYAKGEDSGMANTTGAGWLVKTQRDRGLFYQNFTLGLLRSGGCVGWHHFKYQDNDPENLKTDPSNRDSNKGIVTSRFEEYPPFLKLTRELNLNVYDLMTFDDEHARHGR